MIDILDGFTLIVRKCYLKRHVYKHLMSLEGEDKSKVGTQVEMIMLNAYLAYYLAGNSEEGIIRVLNKYLIPIPTEEYMTKNYTFTGADTLICEGDLFKIRFSQEHAAIVKELEFLFILRSDRVDNNYLLQTRVAFAITVNENDCAVENGVSKTPSNEIPTTNLTGAVISCLVKEAYHRSFYNKTAVYPREKGSRLFEILSPFRDPKRKKYAYINSDLKYVDPDMRDEVTKKLKALTDMFTVVS